MNVFFVLKDTNLVNYFQFHTVVRSTKEIMNKAQVGTKQNYTPMNINM